MNVKSIVAALNKIENEKMLNKEIVIEALKEALAKAYRKQIHKPEVETKVEFNEKTGKLQLFHLKLVVEEPLDDEIEISLEEANSLGDKKTYQLDDYVAFEQNIGDFSRAAVMLAKNVLKQKIREAEKESIYNEYCDKVGTMVNGVIESIEPKYMFINIGKTLALMSKNNQNPAFDYREGQRIKVVITKVSKETKGAHVLVSQTDNLFVKNIFELNVPEVADGIVEIKAIARDAGDRCKVGVISNEPHIDPIGSCIGPRSSRIQSISEQLGNEKVDVFLWKDDLKELLENTLAPASIVNVIESNDQKSLIVIVEDENLSLAIGKRGKNARLAAKLVGKKVDIKSISKAKAEGIEYWKTTKEVSQVEKFEEKLQEKKVVQEEVQPKKTVKKVAPKAKEKLQTIEHIADKKEGFVVELVDEERKPSIDIDATYELYDHEELQDLEAIDEYSWIDDDDIDFEAYDEYYDYGKD